MILYKKYQRKKYLPFSIPFFLQRRVIKENRHPNNIVYGIFHASRFEILPTYNDARMTLFVALIPNLIRYPIFYGFQLKARNDCKLIPIIRKGCMQNHKKQIYILT